MPSSGSGTGLPVTGGAPVVGTAVARPLPYTLLSLGRFAQIAGISPMHFYGADAGKYFHIGDRCSETWSQYSWQASDSVSRSDLAFAIANAERDVAAVLGYWPAPNWIAKDVRQYSQYHRREFTSYLRRDVGGDPLVVRASWGRIIAPGKRAVALAGTASVTGGSLSYSDADGDGFVETATVTLNLTGSAAKDAIDDGLGVNQIHCDLKVFVPGKGGTLDWEIRPARAKSYAGGIFTATFYIWQFINPDLYEHVPHYDDDQTSINLLDTSVRLANVDVYYEYADYHAPSAEFFWPAGNNGCCTICGGGGCQNCATPSQLGCLTISDVESGMVRPLPAIYDAVTETWTGQSYALCRAPEQVKLWYLAGAVDDRYLTGDICEPMPSDFAEAIVWMAIARLERPFCSCGNLEALATNLRRDLTFSSADGGFVVVPEKLISNPFGTRKGEVMAWNRIGRLSQVLVGGAAI